MVNLSLTCKERRYLMKAHGFPSLGEKVLPRMWTDLGVASTAEGKLPDVWTRLVKDPHACQLSELKEIGRQVKIKLTGSKGQLIVRLQEYLHINKPLEIPPSVLFSMVRPEVGEGQEVCAPGSAGEVLPAGSTPPHAGSICTRLAGEDGAYSSSRPRWGGVLPSGLLAQPGRLAQRQATLCEHTRGFSHLL